MTQVAPRPLLLGSVARIPLYVDASWFVVLALMTWTLGTRVFPGQLSGLTPPGYWVMGLVAVVLLFACVLLHELSHALVARALGTPVTRITLFIFGGVAQLAEEARRPGVELAVALAGPLASGALAWACWQGAAAAAGFLPSLSATTGAQAAWLIGLVILKYLGVVNISILLFNLLPGFPLDGGRVLRAMLWAGLKDWGRATKIASVLGSGLGAFLCGLGLLGLLRGRGVDGIWSLILGAFLWNAARASFQEARLRQSLDAPSSRRLLSRRES